jgi:hypothetical protein
MAENPTESRITDCPVCGSSLTYVSLHGHEGAKCANEHEFTVYGACDALYPSDRRDVMHVPYAEFMRMLDLGAQLHNALVRYSEGNVRYEGGEIVSTAPLGPSKRMMGRLLRLCDSMAARFTERWGDENGNPLRRVAEEMREDGYRPCD